MSSSQTSNNSSVDDLDPDTKIAPLLPRSTAVSMCESRAVRDDVSVALSMPDESEIQHGCLHALWQCLCRCVC
jgi:hypothetical protein